MQQFDQLYAEHREAVRAYVRRRAPESVVDDVVSDVFLVALRKLDRVPEEPLPWLYAVARNAIVDRARARTEMPADIPEEAAPDAGPADRAEQGWVAWRVHRALEELPEREREVISLAYWSGLSQSEVAEFLGLPLGTVKTRTRAALSHLAELLEEELG